MMGTASTTNLAFTSKKCIKIDFSEVNDGNNNSYYQGD